MDVAASNSLDGTVLVVAYYLFRLSDKTEKNAFVRLGDLSGRLISLCLRFSRQYSIVWPDFLQNLLNR